RLGIRRPCSTGWIENLKTMPDKSSITPIFLGDKLMRSLFMIGAAAAVTAALASSAAVAADPVRSAIRALKPSANLRVVGGTAALEGSWPWQVYVQIPAISGGRKATMKCGGSVIAPRWILTAAHCLQNLDTSQTILVGEQQSSAGASRAISDL